MREQKKLETFPLTLFWLRVKCLLYCIWGWGALRPPQGPREGPHDSHCWVRHNLQSLRTKIWDTSNRNWWFVLRENACNHEPRKKSNFRKKKFGCQAVYCNHLRAEMFFTCKILPWHLGKSHFWNTIFFVISKFVLQFVILEWGL